MAKRDGEWSSAELAAAVEAYIQMSRLEQRGEPYNKSSVRRMLLSGPLAGRSTSEQRMQNITYVMQSLGLPTIKGYKGLSNVGAKAESAIRAVVQELTDMKSAPIPLRPPIEPNQLSARKLLPTGYWILVSNPARWNAAEWLKSGESELLYKVSEHNRKEIQAGDLAVLRVNTKGPRVPAHIIAILMATGPAEYQSDWAKTGYVEPDDAHQRTWRAPFRVLADLSSEPIVVDDLPEGPEFTHLKRALQTSTIPMPRSAFTEVFRRAHADAASIKIAMLAQTPWGAAQLEAEHAHDPKARERVSKMIERGKVGQAIKLLRGGRCQVCDALGLAAVAFLKKDGAPYSEAHHVYHVSEMRPGSLAASNIMVVCPNHHREVHFGDFEVLEHRPKAWLVRLGARTFEIDRTAPQA